MGAATQVRIGEPDRKEMSVYSVLTINCLFAGNSDGVASASQLLIHTLGGVAAILEAVSTRRPAAAACRRRNMKSRSLTLAVIVALLAALAIV